MAYFNAPDPEQNPALFEHDGTFRQDVREYLLSLLDEFWGPRYRKHRSWSTVWIAGSAITSQWRREKGDLDILIGVDFLDFALLHPEYRFFSEEDMAKIFNRELKAELWPETTDLFGHETTWYVNPHAADIREINPYAAYNLSADEWTVEPPELPVDWSYDAGPLQWRIAVEHEAESIRDLYARWEQAAVSTLASMGPRLTNVQQEKARLEAEAERWWDQVHGARHNAFGQGLFEGAGFFDWHNWRWQAHKSFGTVALLQEMRP